MSLEQQMPPFRAEHIGSLLRPHSLLDQRARFARGEIGPDEMRQSEDAAILDAIRLQERLGFRFVTDGEFRRRSYHSYFYQQLGDLSIDAVPQNEAATGRGAQPLGSVRSRDSWTAASSADGLVPSWSARVRRASSNSASASACRPAWLRACISWARKRSRSG